MKAAIFATGLALLVTGCIIRSSEPVTEKKGIGKLLDDAFKGTAKVADEVTKVDNLAAKAARSKLTQNDVGTLMGAIVKGGSESIAKFKEIPVNKFDDLINNLEFITIKFDALLDTSPDQLEKMIKLMSAGKTSEAVSLLKHNTNIAKDKNFLAQLRSLDSQLDVTAEAVADNHRLANSVGKALDNDTPFQMRFAKTEGGFNGSDVAAELKVGRKDMVGGVYPNPDMVNFIKVLDEIAGTDMWNEMAHIELMLRHADDGKPIYTTLTKTELQKMGVPFDQNFTEPTVKIHEGQTGYLFQLYKGPNPVDEKALLEELLQKHSTTY